MHSETKLPEGTRAIFRMNDILDRTEQQMAMLGRMLETISDLACDNRSVAEGTDMPIEVKKKATDSVERILHQIDNIIEDMPRWGSAQSDIEKHHEKLMKAAAELHQASAFKAQMECLPSSRHPIHLHEYAEGRWGAYLIQHGEARLMGSGSSAQEALHDFDRNFVEGEETLKKARQPKKSKPKSSNGPKNNKSAGPA